MEDAIPVRSHGGVTLKDVAPAAFVATYAAHLKRQGRLSPPKWTEYVKTGHGKELPPLDPDWYFVRAASVARKIYLRGGLGVGALRRIYGGKKRFGVASAHFVKGSGKVVRDILLRLEDMGIVEAAPGGGRRITSQGQGDLDRIASQVHAASQ
eukprot:gnl/Trimastix_PCT/77.p2 GENE.gnl/Trimastix_PCT/77~~gnl/Trimastix_PCT/77.p2  ORF type:complete len:169 (+),score=33.00 gnl/Trimastix_PCT/77:50-508(+)